MPPIPGKTSHELGHRLRSVESQNVTFLGKEFPVFWRSARGAMVQDVDGNAYLDLTAAFGVANAGHSNPRVADAIALQAKTMMHAMGDVHPTEIKLRLLEKLGHLAPGGSNKTFLASTGAEAVEAALKTAILATGKPAFAAFENAYHGLSIGALEVSGIAKFRTPFASALPGRTLFLPFGNIETARAELSKRRDIAAVIVEPIQGRGGNVVPPAGFLRGLRDACTQLDMLLIVDEMYTGFGRTGAFFACNDEEVVPDILCLGKALANGFPISAIVARSGVMDAWPVSRGEALHTSTFLGNPMGCAAAIATIEEIARLGLVERARKLGSAFGQRLERLRALPSVLDVRGRGLMWGVEFRDGATCERTVQALLKRGVLALAAGASGNVLHLTPPLVIDDVELMRAADTIEECIR